MDIDEQREQLEITRAKVLQDNSDLQLRIDECKRQTKELNREIKQVRRSCIYARFKQRLPLAVLLISSALLAGQFFFTGASL